MKYFTKKNSDIHLKGWGYEKWIVNIDLYCGKLLKFEKGKQCSWHYHKIKTETFYVHSGKIKVYYSESDNFPDSKFVELNSGEKFHIPIGMRHRILALEESEIYEFSTQHFESDSYRLIKGD